MSYWVGNILLVILNVPIIGLWVKLLRVSFQHVYPAILLSASAGAHSVINQVPPCLDSAVLRAFGLHQSPFMLPAATALFGASFSASLWKNISAGLCGFHAWSSGSPSRPISAGILAVTTLLSIYALISGYRQWRAEKLNGQGTSS